MTFMQPSGKDAAADALGPAFDELKMFIVNATGHARLAERDDLLLEKITRRIEAQDLPSIESYLDFLKHGAAGMSEFDRLIDELTIGETSFFRHQEHFGALRDHVLPECLQRNAATRQLRIWSAGCANGAEAYSIAILVHALLGDRLDQWNVVIVGSDINRTFLAEAETGQYSAWTLRDVAAEQRPAFFVRHGDGWSIRELYRRHVRFVHHNLASEEFPCFHKNIFAFDIVMCRNVMIYFDALNNKRLAGRLSAVLADNGWLFTGPADFNTHLESGFTLEKVSGALVYRKREPGPHGRPAVRAAFEPARRTDVGQPPSAVRLRPRAAVRRHIRNAGDKPRQRASRPSLAPQLSIETVIELANRADWAAAARYCEAFLAADPCNAPAHYYCALVQQYSGATAAAEEMLKRAVYLDGRFALAHYQLGLLRKDALHTAQSIRSFRNVLSALSGLPDTAPVSPCGQIAAFDLRKLATQQLALLEQQCTEQP